MVTNDIKMGSIPTGIWPTTFQNKKLPYLKLRLGTYAKKASIESLLAGWSTFGR